MNLDVELNSSLHMDGLHTVSLDRHGALDDSTQTELNTKIILRL